MPAPVTIPVGPHLGIAEVPVGPDAACHRAEVLPQFVGRGPSPEPVAVVDRVHLEPRLEHQRVRDHRIVVGIGVLLDVEVLLHDATRVREEQPLCTQGVPPFVRLQEVRRRDGDDAGVRHRALRMHLDHQLVLLEVLGTVVPAREDEDHRIPALHLAEPVALTIVSGQLVVREGRAGNDVRPHDHASTRAIRSPARTGTSSQFSLGATGQFQEASYEHDGW